MAGWLVQRSCYFPTPGLYTCDSLVVSVIGHVMSLCHRSQASITVPIYQKGKPILKFGRIFEYHSLILQHIKCAQSQDMEMRYPTTLYPQGVLVASTNKSTTGCPMSSLQKCDCTSMGHRFLHPRTPPIPRPQHHHCTQSRTSPPCSHSLRIRSRTHSHRTPKHTRRSHPHLHINKSKCSELMITPVTTPQNPFLARFTVT